LEELDEATFDKPETISIEEIVRVIKEAGYEVEIKIQNNKF